MSINALSGHGTLIARAPALTPTVFTTIAELGDITPPGLSRNEFDATAQQEDIDSYAIGVLRRTPITFPMNFIPSDASQDHIAGLHFSMIHKATDGWRVTFPDGTAWVGSGVITNLSSGAPVDGKLTLNVTIRLSGKFTINGIVIG
jgi:hypothetical protein